LSTLTDFSSGFILAMTAPKTEEEHESQLARFNFEYMRLRLAYGCCLADRKWEENGEELYEWFKKAC